MLLGSLPQAAASAPPVRVAIEARAIRPGELIVLTIATAADAAAVTVRVFEREMPAIQVTSGRWRALAGIDLEQAPGAYTIAVEARAGARVDATSTPLVVRPKRFPTRRLTVAPDYVNPPPELRARIEADAALLRGVYAHSAAGALWTIPFVRPVPGAANSGFGTRSIFNGERRNPHGGADLLSGAGTPVHAPNAGRIVAARSLFFSGNTVVIDHGQGLFSMLAHLSRIDVAEGEAVRTGQVVGLVGATGRVTGPHLHWALRIASARVDPMSALALLGDHSAAGTSSRRGSLAGASR